MQEVAATGASAPLSTPSSVTTASNGNRSENGIVVVNGREFDFPWPFHSCSPKVRAAHDGDCRSGWLVRTLPCGLSISDIARHYPCLNYNRLDEGIASIVTRGGNFFLSAEAMRSGTIGVADLALIHAVLVSCSTDEEKRFGLPEGAYQDIPSLVGLMDVTIKPPYRPGMLSWQEREASQFRVSRPVPPSASASWQ